MKENLPHLISSSDNTLFKQLKKLAHSARERRKQGKTLLDGVHLINAAASAGITAELIILKDNTKNDSEITQCLTLFPLAKIISLDKRLFDQVSPVETPVGILAQIAIRQPNVKTHESAVLLENVQDPGNLGTILRTAAASGISSVYLSKGCAEAWSPKALRSGMGAQFNIDIIEQSDLTIEINNYKKIVATSLTATKSIYNIDLLGSVAFLFGNEGSGVSKNLLEKINTNVIIPMPGNIESLNVAAAVAICLFERVRQKIQKTSD